MWNPCWIISYTGCRSNSDHKHTPSTNASHSYWTGPVQYFIKWISTVSQLATDTGQHNRLSSTMNRNQIWMVWFPTLQSNYHILPPSFTRRHLHTDTLKNISKAYILAGDSFTVPCKVAPYKFRIWLKFELALILHWRHMRLCSSAVVINTVLSGHGIPNAQLGCIFLSSVLGFHQPHADVASRSREPQLVLHLYLFLRDAQKESIMHTYDSNINKYTNLKKACNQRCSDGGYIGIYTPKISLPYKL